jgi:RNA polymerase sigma-70 factor (ECF subfamily)
MDLEEAGGALDVGRAVPPVDDSPSLRPEDLVDRYQRRIYAVIYRMVGRHSETDDLCQETFLQIFRGLPGFRSGTNLDSWVYRIAMNVSIDYLRRAGKNRKLKEELRWVAPSEAPREGISPETAGAVRQAIDELPPEQKSVLVLRIFEGLSHEEIAKIVDAPVATVRWRLFSSLEKLGSVLEPHGDRAGERS